MFPYVEMPVWRLGPLSVQAWPILVATGVFVSYLLAVRRSPRLNLDRGRTARCALWTVVCGILGAHLFKSVYTGHMGGMSSFGALLGGIFGAAAYRHLHRRLIDWDEVWRAMDLAYVLPFGWIFGRIGCTLLHDHPGLRTQSWLAVRYPDSPRYDLAFLEVLFLILMIAAFMILDRWKWPAGFFAGLFLATYGPFRLALDQLHVDPPRYHGWSVDQWAFSAATLAGIGILIGAYGRQSARHAPASITYVKGDHHGSVG